MASRTFPAPPTKRVSENRKMTEKRHHIRIEIGYMVEPDIKWDDVAEIVCSDLRKLGFDAHCSKNEAIRCEMRSEKKE